MLVFTCCGGGILAIILARGGIREYVETAKADRAHMDCITLKSAMHAAAMQNVKKGLPPPQTLDEALEYIDGGPEKLIDPWGQQYQFRWDMVNNKQVAIVSTTNPDTGELISSQQ